MQSSCELDLASSQNAAHSYVLNEKRWADLSARVWYGFLVSSIYLRRLRFSYPLQNRHFIFCKIEVQLIYSVVLVSDVDWMWFMWIIAEWFMYRFLCPWDFAGKSTGMECHCLLCISYAGNPYEDSRMPRCIRTSNIDICSKDHRHSEKG